MATSDRADDDGMDMIDFLELAKSGKVRLIRVERKKTLSPTSLDALALMYNGLENIPQSIWNIIDGADYGPTLIVEIDKS